MQYCTDYTNIDVLQQHLYAFKQTKQLPTPLLILAPLAGFTDLYNERSLWNHDGTSSGK